MKASAVAVDTTPLNVVARRVVRDYLGVSSDEHFLVVVDQASSSEISEALIAEAVALGADPSLMTIRQRTTSGAEPPEPVAAAMVAADVCLCAASRSLYHTNAKGRAQANGTRGSFNAPASVDAWTNGAMTADFFELQRLALPLAERLRAAKDVRVTSPAGTDIVVSAVNREPKGWLSGIARKPGEVTAYPGGEVSFPPLEGTSEGQLVLEYVMTDLGLLTEPIFIDVRDGVAAEISGGVDAQRLRALVAGVEGATNIAELGIGLNPKARLSGDITEAKKRLGTAHFALGDNAGGYGGIVECPLHLDAMVLDATVSVDGEAIIENGELLFDRSRVE